MNYTTYVPIVKWKQGEYQALLKLSDDIKKHVCPLIEIPPVGYDFEKGIDAKSIEEHVKDFGSRLKRKWGNLPALVDIACIRNFNGTKSLHIENIFSDCRANGCDVVPVVSLKDDDNCLYAYKNIIAQDRKGVALRVKLNDYDVLADKINRVLSILGVSPSETDLIIDFEEIPLVGTEEMSFDFYKQKFIDAVPMMALWRSFIIAGSSFPDDIAALNYGENSTYRRLEWRFYKYCKKVYENLGRVPTFADYTVSTHEHKEPVDMKLVKPLAKLKYTFDDTWYFNKGHALRGTNAPGFGQYVDMCKSLAANSNYRGANFSDGDKIIFDCAHGAGTGNLTTWVCVSTNQHIVKVVVDLSKLYGFSI